MLGVAVATAAIGVVQTHRAQKLADAAETAAAFFGFAVEIEISIGRGGRCRRGRRGGPLSPALIRRAVQGARKRLDVVGVCVVGFLTAFGGGTLRDILRGLTQAPDEAWLRSVLGRRQGFERPLEDLAVPIRGERALVDGKGAP